MTDFTELVALSCIISWGVIRQILIKKKKIIIPKWIDYPIVLIVVLWTAYIVYDTLYLNPH